MHYFKVAVLRLYDNEREQNPSNGSTRPITCICSRSYQWLVLYVIDVKTRGDEAA